MYYDCQSVIFEDQDNLQRTVDKATIKESMFIAWFQANTEYEAARQLTYNNFSTEFVWKHSLRIWEPRKTNTAIGRLFFVLPSAGELYYLRMLLNIVKGPRSYEELRSFNGVVYPTFRDACYAHGLLDDDQEYIDTIEEANLVLSDDELSELTLIEIEQIFNSNGKTLREYATMLFPNMDNIHSMRRGSLQNKLILDELRYYRVIVYKILQAVNSDCAKVFFLYGYRGTGKTFVWNTILVAPRSKGQIVLTVASSGIASLLLPGGRTAHSRFAIPLTPDEYSTYNIKQGSSLAELILAFKLIIWGEVPMMNKFCFEALDRTMRDLLQHTNHSSLRLPFGGKTVVFGGDFKQILLVITKGSRQDIVNPSINSSYLWHECKLLSLTQNMRLRSSIEDESVRERKEFAQWILDLGDGKLAHSEDRYNVVPIPPELLITNFDDPIHAIVEAIYSDYLKDPTEF
ncbi:uncharacterized protein LOC130966529 [Arachis stenosperma]|uniref:uncharacterized protein LOC130966529 n=1 Tax=Arachis stenosperma TaxID=217475 RepID=UPI0025AC4FD8|nr:uncharacterized protein LOC130966529 [Arachis stenosperma]